MNYFYFGQFKKHILQFCEVFRGIEVQTGISSNNEIKTIEVPIVYGAMDKVVAAILANNTQNLPLRLPTMAAYLNNINMASELFVGTDTTKDVAYTPRGGVFPDDVKTFSQIRPIPYKLNLDLHICTSNMEQMLQILEQILILFNPSLQIQTSDKLYDGGRIKDITLVGITNNENFPLGTDKRTITYSLNFETTVYLTAPVQLRNDRIQQIRLRLNNDIKTDLYDEITIIDIKEEIKM